MCGRGRQVGVGVGWGWGGQRGGEAWCGDKQVVKSSMPAETQLVGGGAGG
jgi:hypothetical protein